MINHEDQSFVFLDPDGTQERAVFALILHPTGVRYDSQYAGYLTKQRSAEGFLIPLRGKTIAEPLMTWFGQAFRGTSYAPATTWDPHTLTELRALVGTIACWHTDAADTDTRHYLRLDESRLPECTEAWVPIETPYGKGILLFPNSD